MQDCAAGHKLAPFLKTCVDRFIEWRLNRAEKPWEPSTVETYRRELRKLERATGKREVASRDGSPLSLLGLQAY
jgi:hypothetical protein